MWVKFTGDFDFNPAPHKGRVTVAFKAGQWENVPRDCAEAAIAAKKAVKAKRKVDGEGERSG